MKTRILFIFALTGIFFSSCGWLKKADKTPEVKKQDTLTVKMVSNEPGGLNLIPQRIKDSTQFYLSSSIELFAVDTGYDVKVEGVINVYARPEMYRNFKAGKPGLAKDLSGTQPDYILDVLFDTLKSDHDKFLNFESDDKGYRFIDDYGDASDSIIYYDGREFRYRFDTLPYLIVKPNFHSAPVDRKEASGVLFGQSTEPSASAPLASPNTTVKKDSVTKTNPTVSGKGGLPSRNGSVSTDTVALNITFTPGKLNAQGGREGIVSWDKKLIGATYKLIVYYEQENLSQADNITGSASPIILTPGFTYTLKVIGKDATGKIIAQGKKSITL
jgi:hypothetical protein